MKTRAIGPGVTACVAALLFLLLFCTGIARAAEMTVDSTGDQPDAAVGSGGCETAAHTCTLRAAIEEADASAGVLDEIVFDPSVFDGRVGDAIELATPLPAITGPTRLLASGPCETDYLSLPGPCVGIDGPAGGTAFRVTADEEVQISGFAIYGAKTGVEAVGARLPFVRDSWFGLKLDGSAAPMETGIFLDQGTLGAYIGGVYEEGRDVFAHLHVGLDIDGADDSEVRGDYFGVMPDGVTPASNGTDIVIADAETGDNRVARGNVIGRTVEREEEETTVCDGGCNVIDAAEGAGIDLSVESGEEEPASGANRIIGNYIGLDDPGTAANANGGGGVRVGSAENVTIGGPWAGDRNLLNGGPKGVIAGPAADNLLVEGNWLGMSPGGTSTLDPPTTTGIALGTGFYSATIAENRISMSGGTAIEDAASPSAVRANTIGEGVTGERLAGGTTGVLIPGACDFCAVVRGNSIADASGDGVWIEGSGVHLYANQIARSGEAGVYVERPGRLGGVLGTLVGGDTTAEENVISESGGPAIEMVAPEQFGDSWVNLIARNRGSANAGPFIDLVGGSVDGIQPPSFSTFTETGAGGEGAEPGDVVRVFRKAGPSPGEIEGFLAETSVEEGGDWRVTYPSPIPAGTVVAATQSREEGGLFDYGEGTSELAFATTTGPPDAGTGGDGDAGGTESGGDAATTPPGPTPGQAQLPLPTAPPATSIVSRPSVHLRGSVARFGFRSDDANARFRCQLDGGPVVACRSPKTYKDLRPGRHTFKVWAVSAVDGQDPTPARWQFTVERRVRRSA